MSSRYPRIFPPIYMNPPEGCKTGVVRKLAIIIYLTEICIPFLYDIGAPCFNHSHNIT